jgi:hypothetical protein
VKTGDNMVGGVDDLKYSNHDVSDATKFPYLAAQSYLESRGEGPSGAPLLEPAQWILGLYNTGIMNLLDIPHFGHGKYINACVKQLLARVHGGILWMDRPVPINVDLITEITGLPTDGEKPEQYLEDKTQEKAISDEIKVKYGTERGNRGIKINDINDPANSICNQISRLQINAQVSKRRSAHRSSSSCGAVHKGELDELGPVPTQLIPRIL